MPRIQVLSHILKVSGMVAIPIGVAVWIGSPGLGWFIAGLEAVILGMVLER